MREASCAAVPASTTLCARARSVEPRGCRRARRLRSSVSRSTRLASSCRGGPARALFSQKLVPVPLRGAPTRRAEGAPSARAALVPSPARARAEGPRAGFVMVEHLTVRRAAVRIKTHSRRDRASSARAGAPHVRRDRSSSRVRRDLLNGDHVGASAGRSPARSRRGAELTCNAIDRELVGRSRGTVDPEHAERASARAPALVREAHASDVPRIGVVAAHACELARALVVGGGGLEISAHDRLSDLEASRALERRQIAAVVETLPIGAPCKRVERRAGRDLSRTGHREQRAKLPARVALRLEEEASSARRSRGAADHEPERADRTSSER